MSAAHLSADKPHGLVPQDAALADYLDGLLKDDEAQEPSYPPVKLAIVATQPIPASRPEYELPQQAMPNAFIAPAEATDAATNCAPVPTSDLTLELPQNNTCDPQLSVSIDVEKNTFTAQTEPDQAQMPENPSGLLASALPAQAQPGLPHQLSDASPNTQLSPWRIFSAGAIKIAIARTEIQDVLSAPPLKPIAGAPPIVAGVIEFEGRARMVLSLPDWLGAQKPTDTTLTFGAQGLWGLNVGAEVFDFVWDEAQTSWREAGKSNPARPGFMGFNQASGLVFIDPSELRALFALKR